jgi:hypothetical protein
MSKITSLTEDQVERMESYIVDIIYFQTPDQTLLDKIDLAFDEICPEKTSKVAHERKDDRDILKFMVARNEIILTISRPCVFFEGGS